MSIARTTQFHEFARQALLMGTRGPLHLAPRMRSQPVAVAEVGEHLVELAEAAPAGHAPELAGPQEESMVEMVRAYARATGAARWVIPISMSGAFGRAQRDGSLLPGPGAVLGRMTFAQWVEGVRAER